MYITAANSTALSQLRRASAPTSPDVGHPPQASPGRPLAPAAAADRVELSATARGTAELTEEEQQQVEELKRRDAEVREHEAAHLAAAGGYARGGAQYEYQTGPDGKQYAVGGEVQIDTSPVPDDPEATITKMEAVIRAALAPAEPSGQDRQVASEAQAAILKAQRELSEASQSPDSAASDTARDSVIAAAQSRPPAAQSYGSDAQPRRAAAPDPSAQPQLLDLVA